MVVPTPARSVPTARADPRSALRRWKWSPGAAREQGDLVGRASVLLAATALTVVAAACTSSSPPAAVKSHPASGPASSAARPRASALARAGLLLPATYQQACANESAVCLATGVNAAGTGPGSLPAGPVPSVLDRPLHFPALQPGRRCPASPGRPVRARHCGGL